MDYLFSQHDLSYLDDVIPEKDKKKKEDEKKKKNKKKGSIDSEIEFVSVAWISRKGPEGVDEGHVIVSCSSLKS